jgi:hypothetical protein
VAFLSVFQGIKRKLDTRSQGAIPSQLMGACHLEAQRAVECGYPPWAVKLLFKKSNKMKGKRQNASALVVIVHSHMQEHVRMQLAQTLLAA